jgi:uncharacterized glyoxalase superfamily protein PhnB
VLTRAQIPIIFDFIATMAHHCVSSCAVVFFLLCVASSANVLFVKRPQNSRFATFAHTNAPIRGTTHSQNLFESSPRVESVLRYEATVADSTIIPLDHEAISSISTPDACLDPKHEGVCPISIDFQSVLKASQFVAKVMDGGILYLTSAFWQADTDVDEHAHYWHIRNAVQNGMNVKGDIYVANPLVRAHTNFSLSHILKLPRFRLFFGFW